MTVNSIRFLCLFLFFTSLSPALPANFLERCCLDSYFTLGPEFYHTHRKRQGGTHQDGWLIGGEIRYDRVLGNAIYVGGHWMRARGTLTGENRAKEEIRTRVYESEAEGRIGFTFQPCWDFNPLLIPFIGYGHFTEKNSYLSPSPLPIHIRNEFDYFAYGFITTCCVTDFFTLGINFTAKYSLNGKSRITRDPFFNDATLLIENKMQYSLELPIVYNVLPWDALKAEIVPFYRYRHYGGRENFPFDFMDTQFNILGVKIMITIRC